MPLKQPAGTLRVFVHRKGEGVEGCEVTAGWSFGSNPFPMHVKHLRTGPDGCAIFSDLQVGHYKGRLVHVFNKQFRLCTRNFQTHMEPGVFGDVHRTSEAWAIVDLPV